MQKNRVFVLGILTIFTVVLAGSVSAFDLNFFGDDSPQEVVIEGVKFNIPAGFVEDQNSSFENQTAQSGRVTYTMNAKTFENDTGDIITLLISDYGEYNVTDEILSQVADDKKTINGHKGFTSTDDGFTLFAYEKNGDLVTVTVTDESLLEEIIV